MNIWKYDFNLHNSAHTGTPALSAEGSGHRYEDVNEASSTKRAAPPVRMRGGGGAEFGFDALDHSVEHRGHADDGAGENAFFGVSANDAFRDLEVEPRELGGPLRRGAKSHIESRCDGRRRRRCFPG